MFDSRTRVILMPQRIFTPAAITFCILNAVGYAAAIFAPEFVASYGALSTANIATGKLWTLLTYSIFNSCGFPLVWDVLVIIFLGSALEKKWGAKSWTIFWMVMAFTCGLLFLAVGTVVHNLVIIGAGPCVFGLIGAFGLVFRHDNAFSIFGTIKAHHAAWIMIAIGVILSLPRPISLIAVAGAAVGYCYLKLLWRMSGRTKKAATPQVKGRKPGAFVDVD
jgi:membrane associated rhomboid family serine protease